MSSRRRHLIAALAFAALAVVCFSLLAWALVEGAVVGNFPSDAQVRSDTAGHQYEPANTVYSRKEAPGRYWLIVGLLGFFGTLFAVLAFLERGSYRISRDPRKGKFPRPDLLAEIDRTCEIYPEGRETLLRARAALVDLNSPAIEAALDRILKKVAIVTDRETALAEIRNLAKALELVGKL